MRDPVTASDGHTYEAEEIQKWMFIGMLRTRGKGPIMSPLTGAALESQQLYPNRALRGLIQRVVVAVKEEVAASVARIPTCKSRQNAPESRPCQHR